MPTPQQNLANQAAGPLGTGMAQGAMDIGSQYRVWFQLNSEAQSNGEEYPKFTEWLQMQQADPARDSASQADSAARTMRGTE